MAELPKKGNPGYQRSETSSCSVTVYAQPKDPVLQRLNAGANKIVLFGGQRETDTEPALINVTTTKSLQGTGSFSFTAKRSLSKSAKGNLRDFIADDAWVDIVFYRHNRPYHVMRGMVDEIRIETAVGGSGVTVETFTVTGRDFQKVWDLTPIWFNKYIDFGNSPENSAAGAVFRVLMAQDRNRFRLNEAVQIYLFDFIKELENIGQSNWVLPKGMPGVNPNLPSFADNVVFNDVNFKNDPPRIAIAFNVIDPEMTNAWAKAQEWSDPAFVEMFTDTIYQGDDFHNTDQAKPDETKMTVVLRDRPFPTIEQGLKSPWFSLPTVLLNIQDIRAESLGRGGLERFNSFFVSPQVIQAYLANAAIEITAPLWDKSDVLVHGLRRFDITSNYQLDIAAAGEQNEGALLTITEIMRERVRDWYALNPYLYNGSINLGYGEFKAQVGKRLRVGADNPADVFTAYIEQVTHTWSSLLDGAKTTLGVTRGFYGSDNDYMDALNAVASGYSAGRQGGEFFGPPVSAGVA